MAVFSLKQVEFNRNQTRARKSNDSDSTIRDSWPVSRYTPIIAFYMVRVYPWVYPEIFLGVGV